MKCDRFMENGYGYSFKLKSTGVTKIKREAFGRRIEKHQKDHNMKGKIHTHHKVFIIVVFQNQLYETSMLMIYPPKRSKRRHQFSLHIYGHSQRCIYIKIK